MSLLEGFSIANRSEDYKEIVIKDTLGTVYAGMYLESFQPVMHMNMRVFKAGSETVLPSKSFACLH